MRLWIVLIVSAILEAVWANALGASDGLTKLVPSVIFVCGLVPGMVTLAYVAKHMAIGTAYAVWAGLGAAFTVIWAMLAGTEPFSVARVVLIVGIVGSVVGLKLIKPSTHAGTPAGVNRAEPAPGTATQHCTVSTERR